MRRASARLSGDRWLGNAAKEEEEALPKKPDANAEAGVIDRPRPSAEAVDYDYVGLLDFNPPTKVAQRRSIESRARIIAEASEAFMNRGYESVSTHDVSAAAGVTQGLITYHFKSKEGLWQAAMDQVFGDFRNSLAARIRELRGQDDRTFLTEVIRHVVKLEMQFPSIVRFMVESGKHADSHLVWLLRRHIRPIYEVMTHIFEFGQQKGVLRKLPLTNAYYVLLTAGSIFSLEDEIRVVAGSSTRSAPFAEAHADCLISMLMTDI